MKKNNINLEVAVVNDRWQLAKKLGLCFQSPKRNIERNLRGSRKLVMPYVITSTYGLHSFRYTAAIMWNKLTEDLRSQTSLNEFRTKVCKISFEHQCNCFLCK